MNPRAPAYVLDHVGLAVGDRVASRSLYEQALPPLGLHPGDARSPSDAEASPTGSPSTTSTSTGSSYETASAPCVSSSLTTAGSLV